MDGKTCAIIACGNSRAPALAGLLIQNGWTVYYLDRFNEVESPTILELFYNEKFVFIDFEMLDKEINFNKLVSAIVNFGPINYDNAKELSEKELFVKPNEMAEHILERVLN